MNEIELTVAKRDKRGKNHNRRLRAAGSIPAVVYGGDGEPVSIQVERKRMHELLKGGGSENAIYLLKLDGSSESRHTMIREIEIDPIQREILHIDFLRVRMTEKIRVEVAVEAVGVPSGVRNEGGILDLVTREVEVECLPGNIPSSLEIDVSHLHIGQHLEASDLVMPEGVELMEEPERVLVSVSAPMAEEEPEEEAEMEGLLEAEPEEPELIGRSRDEDEEEAEED